MRTNTSIVVIGGGYSGVLAANRLTRRDDVAVTLINPRSTFVDRIRLHQRVAGTHDAVVDYRDVLAERVELVVDTVDLIDASDRSLRLASGDTVDYDYLIYAVGSGSATPNVTGAWEHAHTIATFEEAEALRTTLATTSDAASVTVVGAGPTGVETAAELAEKGRYVTLVSSGPLGSYLHPGTQRTLAQKLADLGVTVVDGPGSAVTEVRADAVILESGRELPSDVTIWTAGFAVPDLAARSGLTTDRAGRLLTDETLTSVDDVRIIATGDAASPSDMAFRMSCQTATQLGPYAGDTVLSRIGGTQPKPIAVGYAALCISLGRRAGIFQLTHRDDSARRLALGGRSGATVKELICTSITKMLALEARRPGTAGYPTWVADPTRRRALEDAPVAVHG